MKKRIVSLDGIRGIAALSVLLHHINLGGKLTNQFSSPFLKEAYNTVSAGANAVTIFFVLSGFLIALYYSHVESSLEFIQKRYTRIFPIYFVVILFLWLSMQHQLPQKVYTQVFMLFLIAICMHFFWRKIKKVNKNFKKGLFLSFIALQIIVIFYLIFINFTYTKNIMEPKSTFLTFLVNITMTQPLTHKADYLELVQWSLVLEVLFYVLYPLVIIHLISFGKKRGYFVSFLFVCVTTLILFASEPFFPSISRASCFIAGIVAGTFYKSQSKNWIALEKVMKKPIINVLILFLFIVMQWGDLNIREKYFPALSVHYFYLSSWIFALTILASLIPDTVTSKIFSSKILVFCGAISYSLYLIHLPVIDWNHTMKGHIRLPLSPTLLNVFLFFSIITSAIVISYLLYTYVEKLYFEKVMLPDVRTKN